MIDFLNKFFSEYSFLAAAIIIGLIVTIEDFKIDKIRNKWIKIGFATGFVLYLLSIIFLLVTKQNINWQD